MFNSGGCAIAYMSGDGLINNIPKMKNDGRQSLSKPVEACRISFKQDLGWLSTANNDEQVVIIITI